MLAVLRVAAAPVALRRRTALQSGGVASARPQTLHCCARAVTPRARLALRCAAPDAAGALSSPGRGRLTRNYARRGAAEAAGDDSVLLSRSQLVSKSVITRTSGTNLGLVTQARAPAQAPPRSGLTRLAATQTLNAALL